MKPLAAHELHRLDRLIGESEDTMRLLYADVNGGFAEAKLIDFDDDDIKVELKSGVKYGGVNDVHTDTIHINRKTMTIVN